MDGKEHVGTSSLRGNDVQAAKEANRSEQRRVVAAPRSAESVVLRDSAARPEYLEALALRLVDPKATSETMPALLLETHAMLLHATSQIRRMQFAMKTIAGRVEYNYE